VTDQDLLDVFSEAGKVDSSQVIIDRATNRSRGFGFVEMATDEAAEGAIKKLNGRDIKGRPIRVNEAQARSGGSGVGAAVANAVGAATTSQFLNYCIARDCSFAFPRAAKI
jgi:RNA recognition motif-containing protein